MNSKIKIMFKKNAYLMFGMAALLAELENPRMPIDRSEDRTKRNIYRSEKKQPIPNGCKEYWFYKSGGFTNKKPSQDFEVVFYCYSSNDKNAIKKYNKFLTTPNKQ